MSSTVTIDHLRAMLYQVQAELARRRMIDFCEWTHRDWITAEHHEYLCDVGDRIISGELRFVAISMPPRHGKSELFSIKLPALYLGHHPDRQIIHASYAAALSNDFSRQVRAVIRDDRRYRQLFKVRLHPDRQRIDDWLTTSLGGMFSVGTGAGVTGHGMHLGIGDDLVKEGDEKSPTQLEAIAHWYISAFRTRLAPSGQILIPMTRWHPDDPIGFVTAMMEKDPNADQYTVINIPGLIETEEQRLADPLQREMGQALWEARFSRSDLLAIKASSPRVFQSLYQGDPQPDVVKLFDAADFIRFPRSERSRLIAEPGAWCFDLAASERDVADFTVAARYRLIDDHLWASHILHKQIAWSRVMRLLKLLIKMFDRDLFVFPNQFLEMLALQEIRRLAPDRVIEITFPGPQDKRSRALTGHDISVAGRYHVEQTSAGDLFVEEHDKFPGRHDDCVDVSSVATHFYGLHEEIEVIMRSAEDRADYAEQERDLLKSIGAR